MGAVDRAQPSPESQSLRLEQEWQSLPLGMRLRAKAKPPFDPSVTLDSASSEENVRCSFLPIPGMFIDSKLLAYGDCSFWD